MVQSQEIFRLDFIEATKVDRLKHVDQVVKEAMAFHYFLMETHLSGFFKTNWAVKSLSKFKGLSQL